MLRSLLSPSLFDHFLESPELGVITPQGTLLPMSVNLADNLTIAAAEGSEFGVNPFGL